MSCLRLIHGRQLALVALGVVLALTTATAWARDGIVFPDHVQQGAMVIGRVPPDSKVRCAGRTLRVTDYGTVVFGVGRDATGAARVRVTTPGGKTRVVRVAIRPRHWPIQRVDGVPPTTVSPPPAIAARIRREQARVAQARKTSDDGLGFAQHFIWPVRGRISAFRDGYRGGHWQTGEGAGRRALLINFRGGPTQRDKRCFAAIQRWCSLT